MGLSKEDVRCQVKWKCRTRVADLRIVWWENKEEEKLILW